MSRWVGLLERWAGWASGALWLGLLWVWSGWHPTLNADVLYLYDLGVSLTQRGSGLEWALPPAPSLVPDLGLSLVAAHASSLEAWQRFYALAMGVLGWWALSSFLRSLFGGSWGRAQALAAAGLVLGLAVGGPASGLCSWLLPSHHGSAFVASLALFAWGLGWDAEWRESWGTVALAVGLGLLLGSDRFLGLWALPALAAMALGLSRRSWAGLAVLGMGMLLVAWGFLRGLDAAGAWVVGQPWRSLLAPGVAPALADLVAGVVRLPLPLWQWGLVAMGWVLWLAYGFSAGVARRSLVLGTALSGLLTLSVLAVTRNVEGRYFYMVVLLPVLLLPGLLIQRWKRGQGLLLVVGLLGLAAGVLMLAPASASIERGQAQWFGGVARSMGWQRGWAGYWLARPLRLMAGSPLTIVPFKEGEDRLMVYPWITGLRAVADREALHAPDFVVLNGLGEQAVRRELGAPQAITAGAGLTVYIYHKGVGSE